MNKIILICIIMVLAGCSVGPEEIRAAQKSCDSHDGIKFLYAVPKNEVTCKDGVRIVSFLGS